MPSNFLEDQGAVRIYTHLTITPIGIVSPKRIFNSLKRNLPKAWKNLYNLTYSDIDTFKIIEDTICLGFPSFEDQVDKTIYDGRIWLGLLDSQVQLLKTEIYVGNKKSKSLIAIGHSIYMLYRDILKPSKYYDKFFFEFRYGGAEDAHWVIDDIREKRPIRIYETSKKRWIVLSQNEKVNVKVTEVSIKPPNNIALYLSGAKKNIKNAKELFQSLTKEIKEDPAINEIKDTQVLFDYFEQVQSAIIFSYTAVEGFANTAIPQNFILEKVNERGIKEVWNKENIERWMSTSEKIGDVLPTILKSGNVKEQSYWGHFKQLEKIRNALIHSRNYQEKDNPASLANLLNQSIFEAINSAIKIINFYYAFQENHPYFPLGIGIAMYSTIELENFETHFAVIKE